MTFSKLGTDIQSGQIVELPQASRRQGLYIIGANGTGKTGLIEHLVVQDINQGLGVGVLDPHGDLTQTILSRLPAKRFVDGVEHATEKDVILLDIANYECPFGLNLFACDDPQDPLAVQRTVDQVMHIFEKLFDLSVQTTPLMAQFLYNSTQTLIANPGYTMADIPLLLMNDDCRRRLVANVTDIEVRRFWSEYDRLSPQKQQEDRSSIYRRLQVFLQTLTRNIVGQSTTTIDMRQVMDERKILLVKLDAQLKDLTSLIGSVIIAEMLNAAYSRSELPINKRKQFNLYADEFQRFATEDFATLLTEARKFGIATTIAHQIRDQLDTQNRAATLNVANLVVFKISGQDAQELAPEFNAAPPTVTETRREANLTYKQNVLEHLRHNGHTNKEVSQFATEYLPKLFYAAQQEIDKSPMGLRITKLDYVRYPHVSFQEGDFYAFDPEEIRKHLIMLNTHLYNLMSQNGQSEIIGGSILKPNAMLKAFSAVLGFLHYYLGHCEPQHPEAMQAFKRLQEIREEDDTFLRKMKDTSSEEAAKIYKLSSTFFDNTRDERKTLKEALYKESAWYMAQDLYWQLTKGLQIGEKIEIYQNHLVTYRFEGGDVTDDTYPTIGYDAYRREQYRFDLFIQALGNLQFYLMVEPIMVESGSYEEKPLAPRTYADVQNEIASTLANLPRFTARVKIATDTQTVEHTVKTLSPEQGLGKSALQQRFAAIQVQNIQGGYLQQRDKVEEEIRLRQENCNGLLPAQAQMPQQQARHARQVPVQENCPNCGSSKNPSETRFCMQCGTKL